MVKKRVYINWDSRAINVQVTVQGIQKIENAQEELMTIERVATMPRNIWRSVTHEHLSVLKVQTPGRVEGMTKRAYSSTIKKWHDIKRGSSNRARGTHDLPFIVDRGCNARNDQENTLNTIMERKTSKMIAACWREGASVNSRHVMQPRLMYVSRLQHRLINI